MPFKYSSFVSNAPLSQSVTQYFQMDPQNYDNYGGIEHVHYCLQV